MVQKPQALPERFPARGACECRVPVEYCNRDFPLSRLFARRRRYREGYPSVSQTARASK